MPPITVVPVPVVVVLHFITCGFYNLFLLERGFRELRARGSTSISPGMAVGFLFIPIVNFVWIFWVWIELGAAISRDYRRMSFRPPPTILTLAIPCCLIVDIGLFFAGLPGPGIIMAPTMLAIIQHWLNRLGSGTAPLDSQAHSTLTKSCPQCAEPIQIEAALCRFCGYRFSVGDVAAAKAIAAQTAARAEVVRLQVVARGRRRAGWVCVGTAFAITLLMMFVGTAAVVDADGIKDTDGNTMTLPQVVWGFVCCTAIPVAPIGAVATWAFLSARQADYERRTRIAQVCQIGTS